MNAYAENAATFFSKPDFTIFVRVVVNLNTYNYINLLEDKIRIILLLKLKKFIFNLNLQETLIQDQLKTQKLLPIHQAIQDVCE